MARKSVKTVRFSQVVERSGQPQVHTLWVAPEKDAGFRRAQQSHRVMTIAPSAVGKTEVGHVGTELDTPVGGQFLIFPKSLKPFKGARVVGIKFELVEQPKLASLPEQVPGSPPQSARRPPPPRKSEPDAKPPARTAPAPPIETPRPAEPSATPATARSKTEKTSPPPRTAKTAAPAGKSSTAPLLRAIKAAMKDLKQGKSVAAYQRLARAVSA